MVMDFSQVKSPIFSPNQDLKIDVAFEPFIKSPFWIDYEMCCMLPTFFFIYKFVKSFVNHHYKVYTHRCHPPSKLKTRDERMFPKLTLKGLKEELEKDEDKFEFFKIKFADVVDISKDHFYLFNFPHWKIFTLLLSGSIILLFVAYHCQS